MAESLKQDEADALVKQVQESNQALASDAQALDQAAQIATDIAGEIQSTQSPPVTPTEPAPGKPPPITPASAPPLRLPSLLPPLPPPYPLRLPFIRRKSSGCWPLRSRSSSSWACRRMNVGEVMHFAVGAIVEFSKSAEEELDLLANNKAIGKGYAVKVGENFGIKLTAIGPVKETIRKLGAA